MKIINVNRAETILFKIDYKTIPELLEFSKENPDYEEFLNKNSLEYRCIRDADYTDAIYYYVFWGFEGYNTLYSIGLYGIETEECFKNNIENDILKPDKLILQSVTDYVRKACLQEKE